MKQGAGERGEVEDLLALVEGFDFDGAEGDSFRDRALVVEQVERAIRARSR